MENKKRGLENVNSNISVQTLGVTHLRVMSLRRCIAIVPVLLYLGVGQADIK